MENRREADREGVNKEMDMEMDMEMDKEELEELEALLRKKREKELEEERKKPSLQESFPKVVLASGSPRRIELMKLLGFSPTVYPSGADESSAEKDPALLTQRLAFLKAEEVQRHFDGETLLIAADTVVFDGNKILGKPKTEEDAYAMLSALSGKANTVYTGVCILYGEKKMGFCEKTTVYLSQMSDREIREYIATGDPMDKAGAYGVQGPFARFVKGIEGDFCNAIGLPIARLYQALKRFREEL